MDPLAALFGIATMVALVVAISSRDEDWHDSVALALLLIVSWAASNLGWLAGDPLRINSVIDGFSLLFLLALFWRPGCGVRESLMTIVRSQWRFCFVLIAVTQMLIDIYREIVEPPFTPWAILLNATFAVQLTTVAYPGVSNGWSVLSGFCRRHFLPRRSA